MIEFDEEKVLQIWSVAQDLAHNAGKKQVSREIFQEATERVKSMPSRSASPLVSNSQGCREDSYVVLEEDPVQYPEVQDPSLSGVVEDSTSFQSQEHWNGSQPESGDGDLLTASAPEIEGEESQTGADGIVIANMVLHGWRFYLFPLFLTTFSELFLENAKPNALWM